MGTKIWAELGAAAVPLRVHPLPRTKSHFPNPGRPPMLPPRDELDADQKTLLEFVSKPEFTNALYKLQNERDTHSAASADPEAFLRTEGATLPPRVRVTMKPQTVTVCLNLGVISICYNR